MHNRNEVPMKKRKHQTRLLLLFCILLSFVSALGYGTWCHFAKQPAATADTITDSQMQEHSQASVHSSHAAKSSSATDNPLYILVNKDHKLPKHYKPDLIALKNKKQVCSEMYRHLKEMWLDCEKAGPGYSISVVSAYRTAHKQSELLRDEIKKNERLGMTAKQAKKDALRTVAPAGYSEHETGLCVDITATDYQMLNEHQAETPENKWLRKHCADYGFILRYPKHKEKITGYQYESWHFRYVGKKAAKTITKKGITLEEYLEDY